MQDWLSARAAATPHRTALIDTTAEHSAVSYSQLMDMVSVWRVQLAGYGVHQHERVALLMPNSGPYVVMIHALAQMGVTLVPLNARLTVDELRYQLDLVGCRLLICAESTHEIAAQLAADDLSVLSIDYADDFSSVESILDGDVSRDLDLSLQPLDLSATQAIVFTSGTSGQPKGVEITFGNHFYSAMASAYRLGHQPDDRWLSVLPLYHVGGLAVIFRSTLYGITTVLHERFDMERIQHSFDHHGITMISLVPTMLYRMLDANVRWPPSLRLILLGGAAASPELLRRASDAGLPVATTYGLTEATSQVATMLPEDARRKPGSVGKPLMFSSVRIVDDHGEPLPVGQVGEVIVSGPTVMKGYFCNAAATAKTLRDGWLHTGDMGYLDADGDLFIVQRRSDLIVTGGENVYPAEVEAVLRAHPAVNEAVVVGVDHPEWGQQVAAAVVLEAGQAITEAALIAHSREHLAGYKQPRRVRFVDALPQTASGKIAREQVKTLLNSS